MNRYLYSLNNKINILTQSAANLSDRSDSNQQPPTPKVDALPICAALRFPIFSIL